MSALSKLEKLMYSIGVVDKASAPVNKIMAKINQLSSQTAGAQDQMMRGFMGAAGGAMMLVGSLNPAIAANQALGEVSSLGVANSSLQQLNDTSINFTAKYGGNAAEVISASYDIQSSISGLNGNELSAFTNASAVMAKATKSDASTATNYLGTMYGIYQNTAVDIGKANWVEQLAGQTATAVRMFKTNGNEMSSAFTSLGAGAQSHGIEMAESMAVLGQLQATMSGSEAGTKYKAFLAGVGNAQKQLGVQLTDTQGKLLPMADVLETLKSKFGNIDTVAKSDALKKAFGSDEATGLIKLLLPQVAQLKSNINELNQQTGMQTATEMADAQTDAWMRLSGGFNAAATSLGQAVLPIIEPVVEVLAIMLNGVLYLSQEFPMLTGIIAAMAVGVVTLMVAFSAIQIVMGLYKFAMIGAGLATSATMVLTKMYQVGLMALRGVLMVAQGAMWLFNAALMANPIGLVVAGVTLLIAGVIALVYYWNDIVNAFKNTEWGQALSSMFDNVTDKFNTFIDGAKSILEWLGLLDGTEAELQAKVTTAIPDNAIAINTPLMQGYMQQQLTAQQENSKKVNASSAYKVEKSPFAQQLSSSISHNSNANTDQSKRVYIDTVTMKSDDIANDFEKLMELTG
jgi:TP901 family phage tail tape measure protein